MDQKLANEEAIRQYLLGTLPEPRLSEIEQELFLNEELSETASLIEDEIIEQFLNRELNTREQQAVKNHFLRPPARRQKLQFARMLRHSVPPPSPRPPYPTFLRVFVPAMAAMVASVVLYLGVAPLIKKPAAPPPVAVNHPPVKLSLVSGSIKGASSQPDKISIPPGTEIIAVDLQVSWQITQPLEVELRHAESEIWSGKGLILPKEHLKFDMPAKGIHSGDYELIVKDPDGGSPLRYHFVVEISPQ